MTIGSRLDTTLADIIVAAGQLADRILNRITPFDEHAAHRYLNQSSADLLAEAESDIEVFEPLGEHPDVPPMSAPGSGSLRPVAAARSGSADPPPDAGPGHSTSDLLIAAANQLQVWRGTRWFRAVDATDDRELSGYRAGYLDELIPELRDRAAQFAAIND